MHGPARRPCYGNQLGEREPAEVNPTRLCEIWDAHHARLLLIARSFGGSVVAPTVEDAVQDAFIELAKQSTEPHDVLGWLVRVTRNRILDHIRRESRRQRREIAHGEQRWFTDPDSAPTFDAEQLSRALEKLPELPRQIITMHLWGEMTFEAIADLLEISSSSAHRHYHQALHVLGTQLQEDNHVTR